MIGALARSALVVFSLVLAGAASAQSADMHHIRWYVHVDMVTGSEPLSFWQAFIEQATTQTEVLLKGNQGSGSFPDAPCCTELTVVSVGTFGTAADGHDMPTLATNADFDTLRATIVGGDPGSSVAFLVRDIALCGGSSNAIGCAAGVACDTNANDDPDLELTVSVGAMEDVNPADFVPEGVGGMAQTLAHERGHTACLGHVTSNRCELMQASGSGGCLSSAECTDIREARTSTTPGDPCDCQTGGAVDPDGGFCTEGPTTGFCSGGICRASSGYGGTVEVLVAGAGDPTDEVEISAPLDAVTDDYLRVHDVPGGWSTGATFPADVQGLAYDADRGVLWGVLDNGADDQIVQIDPATGAITSTLVNTGRQDVLSLAFHPGPTSAGTDDHLLAVAATDGGFPSQSDIDCDLGAACYGDLLDIDPATAAVTTIGWINVGIHGGFRGLAYDSTNGDLYGSAFAGGSLWRFATLSCNGTSCSCSGFCTPSQETAVSLPRVVSGLAYSPDTHRLYLIGSQSGPQLFHQSIGADNFDVSVEIGVEGYTPGGLAVRSLPEPGAAAWLAGVGAVLALARRRHRQA